MTSVEVTSIGVVGKGFVGSVIVDYYHDKLDVKWYDPKVKSYALKNVLRQDVIFIAIMLPDNGTGSDNRVALEHIVADARRESIIVIKSTVVPGTTDWLQLRYPSKTLCFVPEFLTESTAAYDFTHPTFELIGVTSISNREDMVGKLLQILPASPITRVVPASVAEMFKTARNSYLALKLTAFNQIYDVCQKAGIDYEVLREVLAQDPWIGDSHNIIWHKGKRGFSGKCLPKDLDGLISYCESIGVNAPLFGTAKALNAKYLREVR